MLTRIYLDNFRCFTNFEYRPSRKQLIFGANGSGKSSLLEALLLIRRFSVLGDRSEDLNILGQRTRWIKQDQQTCEIDATIGQATYQYRLTLGPIGEPARARVLSEVVNLEGRPIFEFQNGEVHLYNDRLEHKVTYPFDWHRSALATISDRKDNTKLTRFKQWLGGLRCFRINPFALTSLALGEDVEPQMDLSNLAAWYRHLVQDNPKENSAFLESLRETLDGFSFLELERGGENNRSLMAEFASDGTPSVKFAFHELSDGQRCLICLYTILHFVLEKGNTVILDEPENFIALREIQPWLMAVTDAIEQGSGQLLLISHHPEIFNQWAPSFGVRFLRTGQGPVRVEQFHGSPDSTLSPAQMIARGWENA